MDGTTGVLEIKVDPAELMMRHPAPPPRSGFGYGRELFGWMRSSVGAADHGASVLFN
jgi:phosphogluconate dehydratase